MPTRIVLLSLLFAATLFAQNQPPVAEPQTVFTQERTEIILRGSDPEGGDLRFSILEWPRAGELTEPEAIVPPEETDPRTGEPFRPPITSARVIYTPIELVPDAFTFAVEDREGASGVAVVTINPGDEPPPPPVTEVDAHDSVATVYMNTLTTLTLTGAAPDGVSLKFELISRPKYGEISELVQGTEEPRRTASLTYLPADGFLGEDGFEFQACGNGVCDRAVYRIEVVERPAEAPSLVSDLTARTTLDKAVTVALDKHDHRRKRGETIVLRAPVTGNVADHDGDGSGDSANGELSRIKAGVHLEDGEGQFGTARMQLEWPLEQLLKRRPEIVSADVRLTTYRAEADGLSTAFHAVDRGDGTLQPEDFQSEGERVRGAVMPIPSLEEMPVGERGTFTFSVLGDLQSALDRESSVFAVQGRAANEKQRERLAGLDVFTNLEPELEPLLVIETAVRPEPLVYTITSLPEAGQLKDSAGNTIREVPYTLPDAVLTYVPNREIPGNFVVWFQGTDGFAIDLARLDIIVIRGSCANNAAYCNNGR